MKKHRAPLALGILILMAGTFQQEALCRQPVLQTTQTDPKDLRGVQPEWKEFSSREGRFSILLPGTPKGESETKEFPIVGKGEIHLFFIVNESGLYLASHIEIPGLTQASPEFCASFGKGFLQNVGEGTAKGAGGKVIKDTDISMGNDPGKEFLIEVPAGVMTARAYFINRRGYQLLAAPTASGNDLGNVKKFLDSFKVTAR